MQRRWCGAGGADLHDECGRLGIGILIDLELRGARGASGPTGPAMYRSPPRRCRPRRVSFPSRSRSTCSPGAYPAKGDICCHECSGSRYWSVRAGRPHHLGAHPSTAWAGDRRRARATTGGQRTDRAAGHRGALRRGCPSTPPVEGGGFELLERRTPELTGVTQWRPVSVGRGAHDARRCASHPKAGGGLRCSDASSPFAWNVTCRRTGTGGTRRRSVSFLEGAAVEVLSLGPHIEVLQPDVSASTSRSWSTAQRRSTPVPQTTSVDRGPARRRQLITPFGSVDAGACALNGAEGSTCTATATSLVVLPLL